MDERQDHTKTNHEYSNIQFGKCERQLGSFLDDERFLERELSRARH